MAKIKICKRIIKESGKKIGEFAILRCDPSCSSPKNHMKQAVAKYVGDDDYNEMIDIALDNPWYRVIVKGINNCKYTDFINTTDA